MAKRLPVWQSAACISVFAVPEAARAYVTMPVVVSAIVARRTGKVYWVLEKRNVILTGPPLSYNDRARG